jgi:hypothetical protein
MQHNFLSNYCLFYMMMESRECYKILSILDTMSTVRMPVKTMDYLVYEARKEVKPMARPKDKNLKSEFEMIIIKDEDVHFMFNREKTAVTEGKGGHLAIGSKYFLEIMQRNKLLGEVALLKTVKIVMESVIWENYIITHYEITKDKSLLIIQEMFSSTLFRVNNEESEWNKKTKLLFEPLLELMLSSERASSELLRYQKELRTLRAMYPEI